MFLWYTQAASPWCSNAQWTQTKAGNYSPLFLCSTDELSDDEAMVSQSCSPLLPFLPSFLPSFFPPLILPSLPHSLPPSFPPSLPPSLLSSSPSAFASTPLTPLTCRCAPSTLSHPLLTSLMLSSSSHHFTLVLTSYRIFTHTHPHSLIHTPSHISLFIFTLLPHTHILTFTLTLTLTSSHSPSHTHILTLSHTHSTSKMSLMAMTMN